jgi:hypothetical protein
MLVGAGVQASRDIVSQCSCPLQTTSANPLWECHSMLSLLCRTGSQPGAILEVQMIVLKLGATGFGVVRKPAPSFGGTRQAARQLMSEESGGSAGAL